MSLEYKAIDEDVRKGVLWRVSLRAAQEPSPIMAQLIPVLDRPMKREVKSIATGQVTVLHPAPDPRRAQAEMAARAQAAEAQHKAKVT